MLTTVVVDAQSGRIHANIVIRKVLVSSLFQQMGLFLLFMTF